MILLGILFLSILMFASGEQQSNYVDNTFTPNESEVEDYYRRNNIILNANLQNEYLELEVDTRSTGEEEYINSLQNALNIFIEYLDNTGRVPDELAISGIGYIERDFQTYVDKWFLDDYYSTSTARDRSILLYRLLDNPALR